MVFLRGDVRGYGDGRTGEASYRRTMGDENISLGRDLAEPRLVILSVLEAGKGISQSRTMGREDG